MTTDAVGGVWRYSIDLAEGLADHGVRTVLAVLGPSAGPAQRAEAEAVPGLHLLNTGLPLDWTAAPGKLARASERLAALAALAGVGSVHLHAPALVGAARWPAPVVSVAHSCMATWWRAVRGGPMPDDFAWRGTATRAGLLASEAVIAPTAAHARATEAAYGPTPIQVVHNGSRATQAPSRPRRPGVLTAGRLWDAGKAVDWLDRAAPGLDAPILAAGPTCGPEGSEVRFHNLRLLGTLTPDALAGEYAGATVFASMARYEPFGLAVLEAAQAGMALVLSDTPGFRELWDGAAIFVAEEAGLLPALRQALAAPAWAARAQDRARRYTVEAMVAGTLAVHRGVAAWA